MKKPLLLKGFFPFIILFLSNHLNAQPGNNLCGNATTLTSSTSCVNTAGTLVSATYTTFTGACGNSSGNRNDVWYKFVANSSNPTISISSGPSRISVQLLSGSCGSLSSVQCATTGAGVTSVTLNASGLTTTQTYYIRVFSNGNTAGTFNICITDPIPPPPTTVVAGRLKEVFQQTILSSSNVLNYPWEVTYGSDGFLWITEAKGYRVYRMDPSTGTKTEILNIRQGSTFLPAPDQVFNCQFNNGSGAQGGLAGLAIHPLFLDPVTPKNYVYISYIYSQTSSTVFTNRVVRFTYNTGTGLLESPVSLCDTIPGSSDHNSQRMIIKPVGGTDYLFYAAGDMGAGQFGNVNRTEKAQFLDSYEGKILRFNLEADGDAGTLDKWIPNDNPYNSTLGVQSAVYAIGMRNNQGFAYDSSLDILYGSSHGAFSDDEVNIIEAAKNYGHPLVSGYSWDDNVNNTTLGAAPNMSPSHPSSLPMIVDESDNAAALGAAYSDPIFSAYPSSVAVPSVTNLWNTTTGANAQWPSEGWSGLDLYTHTLVPGWKQSLIAASLKWGRLVRMKLDASGTTVIPTGSDLYDTVSYFGSTNRFRDVAFSPDGKDLFVIMDNSSTTSGPGSSNPVVPACAGCVQKYTFLGYADNGGKSTIPSVIDITTGTDNVCNTGTTVTIDATNSSYWVPITGPDGNIMAEIYANGQTLGTVTSSYYQHNGAIRFHGGNAYMNRSITITPQFQPASPVKIRLYFTNADFNTLDAAPLSGVSSLSDIKILKNSDVCSGTIGSTTTLINPVYSETHGSGGYMLQADISGFSTFYFGSSNITLPVHLITFNGSLQPNNTVLLKWRTENEDDLANYVVERSTDEREFTAIGDVIARGTTGVSDYDFIDANASSLSVSVLYYRIRMIDRDGAFRYSNIVPIVLRNLTGTINVSPNPVKHEALIQINTSKTGTVNWSLVDKTGRVLLRSSYTLNQGSTNMFTINMDKYAAGVYFLNVIGSDINESVKLYKQ
ncbi:MAG: PQQ-dependent sugar dehydrogenase [Chitinophagales bacterium]|nr:PQQ-dependent sugar dehydrogenase [Chitinophagales bacterium]